MEALGEGDLLKLLGQRGHSGRPHFHQREERARSAALGDRRFASDSWYSLSDGHPHVLFVMAEVEEGRPLYLGNPLLSAPASTFVTMFNSATRFIRSEPPPLG